VILAGTMVRLPLAGIIRKPGLPVLLVTGYSNAVSDAIMEFPVMRKPMSARTWPRRSQRLLGSGTQAAASSVEDVRPVRHHRGEPG
jgi:hypothetical protein